jgi:DNA-binding winged helix-turn-helix (wHTH) protein
MIDLPAGQLRFGSFVLDLPRGELLYGARHVPLRRQAFDTLHYLIERGGRIVSKTELVQAVWTSPPADPDASVAQCIKEIRKALGAEGRWMIRTVAGTGYEFKAEVLKLRPEAGIRQADSEASSSRRDVLARWIARRPALAIGVALTAGAVLTGTLVLVWSAIGERDAEKESYQYRPIGTIPTGATVTFRTNDGRTMTCVGGEIRKTPRQCWWN